MKRGRTPGCSTNASRRRQSDLSRVALALLVLQDVRTETRLFLAPWLTPWPTTPTGCRWRASKTRSPMPRSTLTRSICSPTRVIRAGAFSRPLSPPRGGERDEVVAEGELVIEGLQRAKDGLYLDMLDGGISRLRRLTRETGSRKSRCRSKEPCAHWRATRLRTALCSHSRAGSRRRTSGRSICRAGGRHRPHSRPPIDVGGYEAQRFFATARDGTRIPYTHLQEGIEA